MTTPWMAGRRPLGDSGNGPRFAARCRFLRMTYDLARGHDLVNLCTHIIRDGEDCIGPFLDEAETDCGLFEPRPS